MDNSRYQIRNYRPEDFAELLRLERLAEDLEPAGRMTSEQSLSIHLNRPNYDATKDLFLIERAGQMIGYMDIATERGICRIVIDAWLHPDHRRQGISRLLLDHAVRRGHELGMDRAHINIAENDAVAKIVLDRLGFSYVRKFRDMKLDMARINWLEVDPEALECRHLQPGEEPELARIQNLSFAQHWGFNPNPVENIIYNLSVAGRSHDDVILAQDDDKIIGYCWTMITEHGGAAKKKEGRIYMIGTDPSYRRRGAGKTLLMSGLAYLKDKGVQVTYLTVDDANEVAGALYESVGFKVVKTSLWYEKSLVQETATR